jgi:ATP-dependent DNA ligase
MSLPFVPPIAPMLALAKDSLPVGEGWLYEPKWDGFRCIVFYDGESVELTSRNERPLTRYFPEVIETLSFELATPCVLDGEIVIAGPNGLDFDALLQRIHPAVSRVTKLATETPASFVAFDLLALGDLDLRSAPLEERRRRLEELLAQAAAPLHLTPATRDATVAADWFLRFEGAGLDGVVAKRVDLPYVEGERVMVKVKHRRTADCVVGGFRRRSDDQSIGSLLLGLYDDNGVLHHVGVTSSFTKKARAELVGKLEPYLELAGDHPWIGMIEDAPVGRRPGTPSRWNAKRDLAFEPLRPELVCEVAYDQLQGDRFRHGTTFLRWRDDRDPTSCRYSQLDSAVPAELSTVFGAR